MKLDDLPLKPADMVAVIERTNLRPNPDNFLLPMFESISNSYHSIVDRFGINEIFKGTISIDIKKDPAYIVVQDNGLGLNKACMDSFRTPFTGQKLKKGGKGFGRFISFKVFDEIKYQSKHYDGSELNSFAFVFDIKVEKEISFTSLFITSIDDTGCSIVLSSAKEAFQEVSSSLTDGEIVNRIVRYFLPYFLSGKMPTLKIIIDDTAYNAEERFSKLFSSQEIIKSEIEIDGTLYEFEIGLSLSEKGSLFPRHAMLLFADDRVIGSGRSLEGKIGTAHFTGADGKSRVVVASVSGSFLNTRANTARTDIEAAEDEIDQIANHVRA